jgi:hypothetical protein
LRRVVGKDRRVSSKDMLKRLEKRRSQHTQMVKMIRE